VPELCPVGQLRRLVGIKIDVVPAQPDELPAAHPRESLEDPQPAQPIGLNRADELLELLD